MAVFRFRSAVPVLVALGFLVGSTQPVRAQGKKIDTDEMVEKGLDYLKRSQHPDGHWDGGGGMYPTVMTALAAPFRFAIVEDRISRSYRRGRGSAQGFQALGSRAAPP